MMSNITRLLVEMNDSANMKTKSNLKSQHDNFDKNENKHQNFREKNVL